MNPEEFTANPGDILEIGCNYLGAGRKVICFLGSTHTDYINITHHSPFDPSRRWEIPFGDINSYRKLIRDKKISAIEELHLGLPVSVLTAETNQETFGYVSKIDTEGIRVNPFNPLKELENLKKGHTSIICGERFAYEIAAIHRLMETADL